MTATELSTGIEKLKSLERVVVRERCGSHARSKYVVLTTEGALLLHAREDCGLLNRMLVGKSRAFEIDVFDTDDREVMKLRRPYTVGPDKMDVSVCGLPAAVVRKEVTFLKPVLVIHDASERPVIRVKGPVSISAQCNFELYTSDKQRIGDISKCWSGLSRSASSDRDSFAIRFPLELDVRYKAAIIATCFLIDFLFYEN